MRKGTLISVGEAPPITLNSDRVWTCMEAFIKADIYAPRPEEVDPAVVTDYLEWWNVEAEVHQSGANPAGISLNGKPQTEITIAIVALTVYVNV